MPLAKRLTSLDGVRSTILALRAFLEILLDGVGRPPTSARAVPFTLKRREAHQERLQAFLDDDSLYQVACAEMGEVRATRCLGLVFNLLDEVRLRRRGSRM